VTPRLWEFRGNRPRSKHPEQLRCTRLSGTMSGSRSQRVPRPPPEERVSRPGAIRGMASCCICSTTCHSPRVRHLNDGKQPGYCPVGTMPAPDPDAGCPIRSPPAPRGHRKACRPVMIRPWPEGLAGVGGGSHKEPHGTSFQTRQFPLPAASPRGFRPSNRLVTRWNPAGPRQ
jgi:hypothetical protein